MSVPNEMFDHREMDMLHNAFRREFGLMPALVREVSATDVRRAAEVTEHIDMVSTLLHHHHHGEDEFVWPLLLERCPDAVAPTVDVMESQHETVAALGEEVSRALTVWRAGAHIGDSETLADALERMLAALREHLATEEANVVPLMEQHIGLAEWNEIVQRSGKDTDPTQLPLFMGLLMYEGDAEIVEQTIANLPAEMRPVIRDIAAKAFAAHSERIHGTPTPPRSTEL